MAAAAKFHYTWEALEGRIISFSAIFRQARPQQPHHCHHGLGPILFIVPSLDSCDIWVQSSVSGCFHSQSVIIRWHPYFSMAAASLAKISPSISSTCKRTDVYMKSFCENNHGYLEKKEVHKKKQSRQLWAILVLYLHITLRYYRTFFTELSVLSENSSHFTKLEFCFKMDSFNVTVKVAFLRKAFFANVTFVGLHFAMHSLNVHS